ncbi:hypothetical protein EAH89_01955 [Roseomonas nepalensis]|uniref:Uncharacterized protein n=1 Tax=Muricoccus nepalensis TaxID=1854500 RepID=A0A502GGC6_9PROT|nr:SIR2 family protein [Roseomonas nepalensis]TPG61337.1 hypothetical protein EAH89_01955 [Roseomonas nepalensis]
MVDITVELTQLLQRSGGAPFLFVGSGFARRYIGLETWSKLLERFCVGLKDYRYYLSSANGDLPYTASLIAKDFHEFWWAAPDYEQSRRLFGGQVNDFASALKIEISNHLRAISVDYERDGMLKQEIELLSQMNVDGIITTNWDLLLEELFPDYKVFIGQQELLFSNPQSVAEIYKIHGCSSQPASLVLTREDYADFQKRNPYLAAKLITIFVEHPVIFLGYSINDPHIQAIIASIAECLTPDKLVQFERNLIFVGRPAEGQGDAFEGAMITIGRDRIRVTNIITDDFSKIYAAVDATKRRIPARVLRYCKEQMYELVRSSTPETKLAVLDLDEIDQKEDVEFVVGVGVATKQQSEAFEIHSDLVRSSLGARGYAGVLPDDILADIVRDQSQYSAVDLLKSSYPSFLRLSNRYIPAFRYLRAAGVDSQAALDRSDFDAARTIVKRTNKEGFEVESYRKQYEREFFGLTTAEMLEKTTPEKALLMIPFQQRDEVDTNVLRVFLEQNVQRMLKGSYASFFRKLICFYDAVEFGF